ncbi:MAG: hypothetical protein ACREMB_24730 [Candidatus Rokuibacteriota bacterium]
MAPFTPPPIPSAAVLPVTVLFVKVKVPGLFEMPPPQHSPAVFPLTVLLVSVRVPELLRMPPPQHIPVLLPLTVVLISVAVPGPVSIPPPQHPGVLFPLMVLSMSVTSPESFKIPAPQQPVAVLPATVTRVSVRLPVLKIPAPRAARPFRIVRSAMLTVVPALTPSTPVMWAPSMTVRAAPAPVIVRSCVMASPAPWVSVTVQVGTSMVSPGAAAAMRPRSWPGAPLSPQSVTVSGTAPATPAPDPRISAVRTPPRPRRRASCVMPPPMAEPGRKRRSAT